MDPTSCDTYLDGKHPVESAALPGANAKAMTDQLPQTLYDKLAPLFKRDMEEIAARVYTQGPGTEYGVAKTPRHIHDGNDSQRISLNAIEKRIDPVRWTIFGTEAATSGNYGVFFIADLACAVVGFQEAHATAGSDGGAVTLQLEKLTSGVAAGSGTNLLSTALSLKATANTVQTASLVATRVTVLNKGDRLALKRSGTLTSVNTVSTVTYIAYP